MRVNKLHAMQGTADESVRSAIETSEFSGKKSDAVPQEVGAVSIDPLLVLCIIAAAIAVAVERLGEQAFRLARLGRDNQALGLMALAAGLAVALTGLTVLALLYAGFGM